MPAVMEADDLGTYVVKFRGAAQGPKALVAELVAGELGRALGLPVPDIVLCEVDPELGRAEPDTEIRELLRASGGENLALDFLPGAIGYDPAVLAVAPDLAARVVWFDALVTNVDRTPRNPNLLVWHRALWLIDHGAALYFHHDLRGDPERSRSPFAAIRDHVLLGAARVPGALEALEGLEALEALEAIDAELAPRVTPELVAGILAQVPDAWLETDAGIDAVQARALYAAFFARRLEAPRPFLEATRVR